ncbi:MAG: hypothetical protein GY754_42045 [bacterium]|nr:hypothetical protein [bacterium]
MKNLFIKNKLMVVLVFTMAVIASMIGCNTTGGVTSSLEGNPELYTEGKWLSPHVYVISATGAPGKPGEGKSRTTRRDLSREVARLIAVHKALIKFKGERVKAISAMGNYELTGIAVAAETEGTIKGGSVEKVFYNENDECQVIFKIEGKDLRKKNREVNIK